MKNRSFLDIKKIKKEITDMENIAIKAEDFQGGNTDMGSFQEIIARIYGYRARLSDLLSSSHADYDIVDHWYKQLEKVWVARSGAKSKDKREGESAEILSFLLPQKLTRKEMYEMIKNKFDLMNSKMEAISREITVGLELRRNIK